MGLIATGCAAESPRQELVRAAVQRQLVGVDGYELDHTRCTDDPRPWFVAQPTSVFICAVRRTDGGCDWFRVDVVDGTPQVAADARDAGCVLPA